MKIWTRLSPNTNISSESRAIPARGPSARSVPAERGRERMLLSGVAQKKRTNLASWFRDHPFVTFVFLPTIAAAIYLFAFAAPQYVSEAHYTVRTQTPRAAAGGLGDIAAASGFVTSPENIASIADFLGSHDVVQRLREKVDLIEIFRPQFADPLFRLQSPEPTSERLRSYYRWQVKPTIDVSTGITTLRVWTFRPSDSRELNRLLLTLSEEKVNELNVRVLEESTRSARAEVGRAEERLLAAQLALTNFRQEAAVVDPTQSTNLNIGTIGQLEADAARARSDLQTILAFSRPNNPQVQNLRNRIAALDAQAAEERRRIAASGTGVTEQLANYTRLSSEVDIATQQLAAARVNLDRSIGEAQRQQIFLSRIVEPNMPERSLFPQPIWMTLYVFASLCVLYGLAWLILTGMREHAR
ncbi:capsule biosynthesis protein [Roseococcus sp. YIM B11640]|uniref:capsule biosynthesis protein n=1 Tax=Roseococcus sp. YIM B11640 TaxID=3133973 RepID=UPI003C7D8673